MVSVLCLAVAAASELAASDRREAPVWVPVQEFRPALQALARDMSMPPVNVGLKRYFASDSGIFLRFAPPPTR
jgi:hypothetical protein